MLRFWRGGVEWFFYSVSRDVTRYTTGMQSRWDGRGRFLGSHSLDSGYLRRADIKHFLSGNQQEHVRVRHGCCSRLKKNRGFGYLVLMRAAQS